MKTVLKAGATVLLLVLLLATAFYFDPIAFSDAHLRFNLWRQGIQSRYALVEGNRIHYFEAGPADGPPLLLIHGLGGRGEDWATLMPAYAAHGFHIFAPDLLGYGRSAQPDIDYSISRQEQMVVRFLHDRGIEKTDAIGWSMGGWVAAKLTIDHPELVDRLVLYDSVGIYFPATFDASLFSPTDKAGLERLFARLQPDPEELPDFAVRAALKSLSKKAWVVDRSMTSMSSGRDLLDFSLPKVSRPTLIVWGTKDALIPPYVGESMHHMIAGSSLTMIEGCGHLAPIQCLAPVLSTTLVFLNSQPPQKNVEQVLPGK